MRIKIYLSLFLTILFSSLIFIFEKHLVKTIDTVTLGFLVRAIAVIFLFVFMILRHPLKSVRLDGLGNKKIWLVVIGVGSFVYHLATLSGLKFSTATNAAIIQRSDIFFSIIIGFLWLKERITLSDSAGMLLMALGYILVMKISWTHTGIFYIGDLLFLIGGFILAFNAVVIKILSGYMENDVIAFYNAWMAGVLFAIAAFLNGFTGILKTFKTGEMWLVILTGIISGLLFQFYYYLIKNLPVASVRVSMLFIPVVTLIIGTIFLGERISGLQGFGIILTLGGLLLIITRHEQKGISEY